MNKKKFNFVLKDTNSSYGTQLQVSGGEIRSKWEGRFYLSLGHLECKHHENMVLDKKDCRKLTALFKKLSK